MTRKRYRKLLRAEFTAVYLRNNLDREYISDAYRAVRQAHVKPGFNYATAFDSVHNALKPLTRN